MFKKLRISFLLWLVIAPAFSFFSGASSVFAETAAPEGKITVYYFHGTYRCPTCNKMERYARETIEKDFKSDLDSGKLVFRSVNVDLKENEHYVKKYQLYTKALVLSATRDGQEIRSKNLDKIWEYVRNKKKYEHYVRDEIATFLK